MGLNRRHFLFGAASIGTATLLPSLFGTRQASGKGEACSSLPLIVTIHAGGGWDPTIMCDPVADPRYNQFSESEVMTAGAINYAPRTDGGLFVFNDQDFFKKHHQRLVVINGVDVETVSHEVGGRFSTTGTAREGLPSLSALAAGLTGNGLPLALLTNGGTQTQGLAPLTRIGGGGNLGPLGKAIFPNRHALKDEPVLDEPIHALVRDAVRKRDQLTIASIAAPLRQANAKGVAAGRSPEAEALFETLLDSIDELLEAPKNQVAEAGRVALGAMRAGSCVAAHLGAGGPNVYLDTHSGHFPYHSQALGHYLEGIDYLIDAVNADPILKERGMVILVTSELGRTTINDGGKDHWPITSFMVFTAGSAESKMPGNRVVGETAISFDGVTANGMLAKPVKVEGGQIKTTTLDDPDGFNITPAHVHAALRKKLGMCDDHLIDKPLQEFAIRDLKNEPPPIFG